MKPYEPDLAHIKKQWARTDTPAPLVLPKELPLRMIECGYRLDRNVLYFGNLPMSEMSAKGILKQFKDYLK
jgi:hypothetical protein